MTESNPGLPGENQKIEGKESGGLPREFFDIQIKFARKLSEVSGRPFNDVLLDSTLLYNRLGMGGKPDPNNPLWQEFISGMREQDLTNYAYQFYLRSKNKKIEAGKERLMFGCFRYDYDPASKAVRIHIGNIGKSRSPLANREQRKQELRQMFENIKQTHPEAQQVKGDSWLYNLQKYRDLFPPEYTARLEEYDFEYQNFSVWGQFLDRNNNIRPEKAEEFLKSLDSVKDEREIHKAFPLRPLRVETSIENFYNFLGLN